MRSCQTLSCITSSRLSTDKENQNTIYQPPLGGAATRVTGYASGLRHRSPLTTSPLSSYKISTPVSSLLHFSSLPGLAFSSYSTSNTQLSRFRLHSSLHHGCSRGLERIVTGSTAPHLSRKGITPRLS
ncbi:uncharacterized protein [Panulirus ornatus]|uniref:uncharacterized protein n=1 Tax=Panulirus ornatus TaxID=150431 RepID=UPI003A880D80